MSSFPAINALQGGMAACLWIFMLLLAFRCSFGALRGPWFLPSRRIRQLHRAYFIILIAAFLVWRAPELNFPEQYDSDESEFLAAAQRLTVDGVGWRFCDLGTCGPLPIYILGWAIPLGLPVNYFIGRLTEIACLVATLFFLLRSICLMVGRRHALLVLFSTTTFYLLAWKPDFIHYSAEDLPVALLAACTWLLQTLYKKPTRALAFVLGTLLGAVPFTKIQAAPLFVYLVAVIVALLFSLPDRRFTNANDRFRCLGALLASVFIVPCLVLLPVICFGMWGRFIYRYILHSLAYGPLDFKPHSLTYFQNAVYFFNYIKPFSLGLAEFSALAIALKFLSCASARDQSWLRGLAVLFAYFVTTIAVILKPGTTYPHYLLFIIVPATLLSAWSMRGLLRGSRPAPIVHHPLLLPFFFFIVCILPQLLDYSVHFRERPQLSDRPEADRVLATIKALAMPSDTMAIWGYAPEYYVESGVFSATRFSVTTSAPGKTYDLYRSDFLSDMAKSRPALFIDATGGGLWAFDLYGWVHPLEKSRYTMYPPLADYIETHYHLEAEISAPRGLLPVLLFVRNDLAARTKAPQ